MKTLKIYFILLLFISNGVSAQISDISFPFISNYSPKEYGKHPRNFSAVQDLNGLMVFGNAYGALMFDGNFWKTIGLPNGITVYSLACNSKGVIYVGSVGDFGYLTSDNQGALSYVSISSTLKLKPNDIGDISNILIKNDTVYFISEKTVFAQFPNKKTQIICKTNSFIQFSTLVNNTIYIQSASDSLKYLSNQELKLVHNDKVLVNKKIKGITSYSKDALLIIAEKDFYILENNKIKTLKSSLNSILGKSVVTSMIALPNNEIGIGTSGNGLIIFDKNGGIIKHINTNNGLRKNNVNNLYLDRNNGLWLVLDNGLAYIDINSPYSYINENSGIQGMGYKALTYKGFIYAATDQGVFYKPLNSPKNTAFKQIQEIEGMVRDIVVSEGTLLCSQFNNIYELNGANVRLVKKIDNNSGPWTTKTFKKGNTAYALVGLYDGLDILIHKNNKWEYSHRVSGFWESSRIFEMDKFGDIWVCHGNKGLFRIKLTEDLKKVANIKEYSKILNLPHNYFKHIALVDQDICLSTANGIFSFDYKKEQLFEHPYISKILKSKYTDRVCQTDVNNIWVFQDESMIQIHKNKQTSTLKLHHKLKGEFIGSYEFIGDLDAKNYIIGSQDGFTLLNKSIIEKQIFDLKPLIRRVEILGLENKILFDGTALDANGLSSNFQTSIPQLPYSENAINIAFTYPNFDKKDKIKYQYAILNTEIDSSKIKWSEWSNLTQIEYPELIEGFHTVVVRAKNSEGEISKYTSYKFEILPPWFRSFWAYLTYLFVLICLIWGATKLITRRFQQQKENLEKRKKEELIILEQKFIAEQLLKEKELIELKNKQLETQVLLKKSELASVATTLNQKKEFLSQVKKNIMVVADDLDVLESKLLKQIIKKIDSDLDVSDNWEVFQLHFDEANNNYLKRLQTKYPKLTPSWLLLCAYIKMNKSNKEMAALLNISLSAVEKRRYRLNEKLALESDAKLTDYLINF